MGPQQADGKRAGRKSWLSTTFIIAVLVLSSVAVLLWVERMGGPGALHARYGLFAPAITVTAHLMVNAAGVGELIPWSIANGAVYGLALGAPLTWIAWMGAALVQYRVARRVGQQAELEDKMERLPAWLRRFPVGHPAFLIAGRWVPLGGPLTNVAAGASAVPLGRFVCCAALGYAPEAMLNAAIGAGLLYLV